MVTMILSIYGFIKRLNIEINQCLLKNFVKLGFLIFFSSLNSDYELYSYNEVASAFHRIPNNSSFIKYIKLISAIQMTWITTINSNSCESSHAFSDLRQTVKQQIAALGSSSKTAYKFLRDKIKVLPVKQQLKWCDRLQPLFNAIDWSTINKNNYYATNETN